MKKTRDLLKRVAELDEEDEFHEVTVAATNTWLSWFYHQARAANAELEVYLGLRGEDEGARANTKLKGTWQEVHTQRNQAMAQEQVWGIRCDLEVHLQGFLHVAGVVEEKTPSGLVASQIRLRHADRIRPPYRLPAVEHVDLFKNRLIWEDGKWGACGGRAGREGLALVLRYSKPFGLCFCVFCLPDDKNSFRFLDEVAPAGAGGPGHAKGPVPPAAGAGGPGHAHGAGVLCFISGVCWCVCVSAGLRSARVRAN